MSQLKSRKHRTFPWGVVCLVASMLGCGGPSDIIPEYGAAANADSYEFEIAMFAELSGDVLPKEKESIYLYAQKDENDEVQYAYWPTIDEDNDNKETWSSLTTDIFYVELAEDSDESEKKTLTDVYDKGLNKFSYLPYGEGKLRIHCDYIEKEDEALPDDARTGAENKEMLNSEHKVFECSYYVGGLLSLQKIWDDYLDEKDVIRVSSGDSFGLSTDVSDRFEDIPLVQYLKAIHFDVDTFGNHNFDKSLSYLQRIIDLSQNHFVISNMTNLTQTLEGVTPYVLYDIPARDEEGNKRDDVESLRVAIVGVADKTIIQSVFPGKFGALNTANDYCSLIQSIEKAYNQNARAFFILAHISSNELEEYLKAFRNNDFQGVGCVSYLEVPPERLEAEFGVTSIRSLDLNHEATREKYENLIDKIHSEIYGQIVGYLRASDSPSVVQGSGDNLMSCTEVASLCHQADAYWGSENRCVKVDFGNVNTSEHHPYAFTLTSNAETTGILKIRATKQSDDHIDYKTTASTYRVEPLTYRHIENVGEYYPSRTSVSSDSPYQIDPLAPTPLDCDDYFSNRDELSSCAEYYEKMKSDIDVHNYASLDASMQSLIFSGSDSCYHQLDALEESEDKLAHFDATWACVHKATISVACNENFKEFKYFEFVESIENKGDEEKRNSSLRTNLASEVVLNYFNSSIEKKENQYDATLINAGAIRGGNLEYISLANIEEFVPFNDSFYPVTVTPSQLVKAILPLLKKAFGKTSAVDGAYPVLSRITFSYRLFDKEGTQIKDDIEKWVEKCDNGKLTGDECGVGNYEILEMWRVNQAGALVEPLYIQRGKDGKAACEKSCVFAESYDFKDNGTDPKLKVTYKSDNWLYYDDGSSKSISGGSWKSTSGTTQEFSVTQGQIDVVYKEVDSNGNVTQTPQTVLYFARAEDNEEINLKMLVIDYLMTGGDGFSAEDFVAGKLKDGNTKEILSAYFTGDNEQEVSTEDICSEKARFDETLDGLNAEDFCCITNLNHAFNVSTNYMADNQSMFINGTSKCGMTDLNGCFTHFNDKTKTGDNSENTDAEEP